MSQIEFDYNARNLALVQELMEILGVADCEELPNKVRGLLRDAQQRNEAERAGAGTVLMHYTSDMGDVPHCERCGRLVSSPNYAYHVCVSERRPE
jgi:hypothetical protein